MGKLYLYAGSDVFFFLLETFLWNVFKLRKCESGAWAAEADGWGDRRDGMECLCFSPGSLTGNVSWANIQKYNAVQQETPKTSDFTH